MSRISEGKLRSMKNTILTDLYAKELGNLHEETVNIAKKSRIHWFAEFQDSLDNIPDNLITQYSTYHIHINYPWGREKTKLDQNTRAGGDFDYINEEWVYTAPDGGGYSSMIKNPVKYNKWGQDGAAVQELAEELKDEAEGLCKKIIKHRQEKAKMEAYLEDVIDKNRTHKQLREVLSSSLHKYLPQETVKRKAIKKEARHVETPDFLGERQTINLLEDN